ncbi:solute carrier family 15 member 4-like [Lineus longissimus]|uniref:solute carrier family 15 member 4-like n=1 Tax=Lineus longissimus TaxID=88925 RepID=UPI002B4F025D
MSINDDDISCDIIMELSQEETETLPMITPSEDKRRRRSQFLLATRIPITELCERLTYHSIAANLVMFCTNILKFDSIDAVTISMVFAGTCYLVPPLGGWIADSYMGQYNTILASVLLHVLGTFFLPAAAFTYTTIGPYEMPLAGRRTFFLIGLFLVAMATGGIKANFSPFGASQVDHVGENAVQTFFLWYYWCITIGATIAYTGIVYIQQEIDFALGYFIPAVTMTMAVIYFVSAKNQYVVMPPKGSQISSTCNIICEGLNNKYKCKRPQQKLSSFLDYAKINNGGSRSKQEVEDVKMLGGVFPIFLVGIIFWCIFAQLNSSFLLQAERMNLQLGDITLPASSLNNFVSIGTLLLVPLLDRVIYPQLDKCWRRPSPLVRMGLGFVFASISVAVAGILEFYRKVDIKENGVIRQKVGGEYFDASHLSVLYQVPQFTLYGISLVFMEITSLEFAYKEAPQSLKAVVTGIYMVTIGLGQYTSSLLVIIVNAATANNPWYPDEINKGYLDYFFFLLTGLTVVGLLIFIVIAKRYKYASERYIVED